MSKVEFNLLQLLVSIGHQIRQNVRPDIPVYIDPKQQGIETPCFFVQLMSNNDSIHQEVGRNIYKYDLFIDITYLNDYNKTDKFSDYYVLIEDLDKNFQAVNYINSDGIKVASFNTHNRKYNNDLSALHYQFRIVTRLTMKDIDEVESKKLQHIYINLQLKGDYNEYSKGDGVQFTRIETNA